MSETPGIILARYAVSQRTAPLPSDVLEKVRVHLLDSLAAIVSGSALSARTAGRNYAELRGGNLEATVIGASRRFPVVEAALANGMCAHADESDDSHESSQTHPGCGVVPSALAVAEYVQASGEDLLKAVELGYEVTIRFGEALSPCMSFARSSLSCHAFAPLFGAGFAAGSLLGFNETQFLVLLNYLAQEASGLMTWRLDQAHTLKSYVFAGMPSSNGVRCAMMVKAGWTGAGDVLGTDRNFFDSISPHQQLMLNVSDLGTYHKILETDLKKYSVGFPIAAPLAALEDILDRTKVPADQIGEVRITYLSDWFKVIGDASKMPDLNLRHCVSATIVEGHLSFAMSHDESHMLDPQIVAAGEKVIFEDAPPDQDRFEAVVRVILTDGSTHIARQSREVLGRIQNPMTRSQSDAKALELLKTVLSEKSSYALINTIHSLEEAHTLDSLLNILRELKKH
ncbi:hypothetical protein B7463_g1557, partial [Scytalidium lignicola]